MKLRLDLHVHTSRSPDSLTDFSALVAAIQTKRLDGAAVTDHNCVCQSTSEEVVIVPGIEVSSSKGHIIGLGSMEPIPRGLAPEYTIDLMRHRGYTVIAPHPFDWFGHSIDPRLSGARFDAVETINASSFPFGRNRRLAEEMATSLGLPRVGGSDSHLPETIGDAYTEIESDSDSTEDILTGIRLGKTTPAGQPTSIMERLRKLAYFTQIRVAGKNHPRL